MNAEQAIEKLSQKQEDTGWEITHLEHLQRVVRQAEDALEELSEDFFFGEIELGGVRWELDDDIVERCLKAFKTDVKREISCAKKYLANYIKEVV